MGQKELLSLFYLFKDNLYLDLVLLIVVDYNLVGRVEEPKSLETIAQLPCYLSKTHGSPCAVLLLLLSTRLNKSLFIQLF